MHNKPTILKMACCVDILAFSVVLTLTGVYGNNIVIVLSDDQDLILDGLIPMEKTRHLIGNMGATFMNAFVSTPICCPSRSSLLTGLYQHNHGTVNNSVSGGCSSAAWQEQHEPHTFAAILHQLNYTTFYAGKYLNQYGKPHVGGVAHVPPGWDWWMGLVGNSRYYNYTLSVNGTAKNFTHQYFTDVIKEYGLDFLRQQQVLNKNFLMVLAPPAPHAPFTPSPKYKGHFKNVRALRTPNFNVPVFKKDKHWLLRMAPTPLPSAFLATLDDVYRSRWETLLSVDDLVEAIVEQLHSIGLLDNTFVIFTSDHGYHIGQFGLPWDKRQPYETDLRIPLLIRGPKIPHKKLVTAPVVNIDLAPSILAMAGLDPPATMDGKSLLPLLFDQAIDLGRVFLIEYKGEGADKTVSTSCSLPDDNTLSECTPENMCKCQDARNNSYSCVRHIDAQQDFIFCKFQDTENFVEAYDLRADPYQLRNIATLLDVSRVKWYNFVMSQLQACTGRLCNTRILTNSVM